MSSTVYIADACDTPAVMEHCSRKQDVAELLNGRRNVPADVINAADLRCCGTNTEADTIGLPSLQTEASLVSLCPYLLTLPVIAFKRLLACHKIVCLSEYLLLAGPLGK